MGIQDTASRTALLLECARPFAEDTEISDDVGDGARYGSAYHEGLQLLALGKKHNPKQLGEKWEVRDEDMRSGLGKHIDSAWGFIQKWIAGDNIFGQAFKIVQVEAPLAGKLSSDGRVLVRPAKLDIATHIYDLQPGEFGGTADLVLEGKKIKIKVVMDHKSGLWEDFSDPKTPQLLTLAVLTDSQAVAVLHYPRASLPTFFATRVELHELQVFKAARILAASRVGDGSLRPGAWCYRCPARVGCPVHYGDLVTRTASMVKAASKDLSTDETVDIGRFHQMWGQLEKLVAIAKQQIKERVAEGEIFERPDGKFLKLVPSTPYETVSVGSIREALGREKAEKEIERLRKLGVVRKVEPEPKLIAK